MNVQDLKSILEYNYEKRKQLEVLVKIAEPSVGPSATSPVSVAYFGIDWDRDLLIVPTEQLSRKTEHQSVFESALDLLMYIATKPVKNESYEVRTAKRILSKYGRTDEYLEKYRHIYHR